jgi:replication factor C subunit 2/4
MSKLFVDKYQPLFFHDFDLEPDLLQILNTMITMDSLNILLIGDVAAGKTSLLNALIREYFKGYNPNQYNENILSINSLKEQGINYYRIDVKTFCQTCSVIKGKKKFVLLDDIDFINEQSQQVFRNCIDKYSKNVHFISSCSNIQKVIESIQSRFTILKMKPVQREYLERIVERVTLEESIDLKPDAKTFILNVSNNTVKVVLNYLEKFKLLNKPITLEMANQLCSNMSVHRLCDYVQALKRENILEALDIVYDIYDKGYSVMDILDSVFSFVKSTTSLNDEEKYLVIPFICKYIAIFNNVHEDEIELSLFSNNLVSAFKTLKENKKCV